MTSTQVRWSFSKSEILMTIDSLDGQRQQIALKNNNPVHLPQSLHGVAPAKRGIQLADFPTLRINRIILLNYRPLLPPINWTSPKYI
jgi:hypothetical protein